MLLALEGRLDALELQGIVHREVGAPSVIVGDELDGHFRRVAAQRERSG